VFDSFVSDTSEGMLQKDLMSSFKKSGRAKQFYIDLEQIVFFSMKIIFACGQFAGAGRVSIMLLKSFV
jgi:hypothetical protein